HVTLLDAGWDRAGITQDDVVDTSNAIAARQKQSPPNEDTARGLRLDKNALLAFWNGTEIDISPNREFVILSTLYNANGAIVGYTELLGAIAPARVGPNITFRKVPQEVKDAVSAIRKALRTAGCPYKVKNVASQGYRLRPPSD
ncbi:MAG: winged helix-turn-helix domain-containing protein, partial [Planctomycetes bacterium]|nr:winged helix-turn-helix domain-containing protein [Planctomycetota bacterium]